MYLLGHLGLGLLAGALMVGLRPGRRTTVAASLPVVFAVAPDVDLYLAGISHRGITHTVWAALGLGVALAVAAGVAARRPGVERSAEPLPPFVGGSVAVLVHLLGDVITPMGLRPLHPLVGTAYSLDLVAARDPTANLALLTAGCLAFGVVLWRDRRLWVPTVRALPAWRDAAEGDRSA